MLALYRVRPVRSDGLLLYRVTRHRGAVRALADGTRVERGDAVVELHLANRRLASMRVEPGYDAWRALAAIRADLAELGRRIDSGDLAGVRAIHGVALIGRAGGRLGFEVHELPGGPRAALLRYAMAGIDAVYHPAGLRRLDGRPGQRRPFEVWMSAGRATSS